MIGGVLSIVFVVLAWSGTFGQASVGDGPTWTGLRAALAIALICLALVYRQIDRLHSGPSSPLLSRGSLVAAFFAIGVPAALESLGAELAAAELALTGSVVALWFLANSSRARAGQPRARGVPDTSGRLLVAIVGILWLVLASTPLPVAAVEVLQIITALVWAGAGLKILVVGFKVDDEVITTLGVACVGIAASHLLTVNGGRNLGGEILAVASVSFAIATAYLELIGVMIHHRTTLEATRERMRDLAHEARTAITAIEATLVGLDHPSAIDPEDREALRSALNLELQSLRLMLTRDQPEPAENFRVSDVLRPIVATSRDSGVSLHWLAPPGVEARFGKGSLIEIVQVLIDNAKVHSGGTEVDVEVAVIDDRIEVRVIDDGAGVDETLLSGLFERGIRRHGSPGRGLGLNIARNLARDHGGELEYRASLGGGACFVLTMPSHGRVIDLSIYEDHEVIEPFDVNGKAPQAAPPDRHRRNTGLPWESHRHRGPEPGGEVAGV